ncbi:MAG: hypothetical protein GIW97_03190 [Candidatus Eremiobacteraeota bacterium]|nr:hypothetical protein [Candidatus Eremiobacteraeota bacterium]
MEFIGTKFSITLGTWRINLAFNVEEVQDEIAVRAPQRSHHAVYPRDFSKVR